MCCVRSGRVEIRDEVTKERRTLALEEASPLPTRRRQASPRKGTPSPAKLHDSPRRSEKRSSRKSREASSSPAVLRIATSPGGKIAAPYRGGSMSPSRPVAAGLVKETVVQRRKREKAERAATEAKRKATGAQQPQPAAASTTSRPAPAAVVANPDDAASASDASVPTPSKEEWEKKAAAWEATAANLDSALGELVDEAAGTTKVDKAAPPAVPEGVPGLTAVEKRKLEREEAAKVAEQQAAVAAMVAGKHEQAAFLAGEERAAAEQAEAEAAVDAAVEAQTAADAAAAKVQAEADEAALAVEEAKKQAEQTAAAAAEAQAAAEREADQASATAAAEAQAAAQAAAEAQVETEAAAKEQAEAAASGSPAAPIVQHPPLTMPDKQARKALFNRMDVNGNGGLSLAEIDKAVVEGLVGPALGCPDFNHKPALIRAYKAADTSGDGFIERNEFAKLLRFIVYFNNLWHTFEEIDSDHDRHIDAQEFAAGCATMGMNLSAEDAAAQFAECDTDGGGMILFGEFCAWCAEQEHRRQEELEREEQAVEVDLAAQAEAEVQAAAEVQRAAFQRAKACVSGKDWAGFAEVTAQVPGFRQQALQQIAVQVAPDPPDLSPAEVYLVALSGLVELTEAERDALKSAKELREASIRAAIEALAEPEPGRQLEEQRDETVHSSQAKVESVAVTAAEAGEEGSSDDSDMQPF